MTPRRYSLLLLALAALHAVLAALLPLSGDEVYYWDCSRHLDWSYFDQPPLVIWAMVPFRALLGETALAVRAPAILASLLVGLFLLPLMRRLGGGPREATWAYLVLHATPLFFVGAFYASTDAAMIAATVGATWAAIAVAQGERRGWWGFAFALGVGFLAKFPVVLVLPALLPALLRREGRAELSRPAPYLAGALAAVLTTPVWLWALRHDFDNIAFQLAGRHRGAGFTLGPLGEFVAANLLLVTPFLLVAIVLAWARRRRGADVAWATMLVANATPVAFFALVALRTKVGGHWGGPTWVLGAAILALTPLACRRFCVIAGAATGGLMTAAVLAIVLAPEPLLATGWSYHGSRRIATRALSAVVGNDELVAAVEARVRPGELVASESYSTAHLLAFLSRGRLDTRLFHQPRGSHGLASLYWYPPESLRGRDVLFVTEQRDPAAGLRELFAEVREEEPIVIRRGDAVVRTVRVLRATDLLAPAEAFTRLREGDGAR